MKRFYKTVEVKQKQAGWSVLLDGKAIKTPAKKALLLPGKSLAKTIAYEWDTQEQEIQPLAMPMMRLAATTLDQIKKERDKHLDALSAYASTDLLCYRSQASGLAERQSQYWDPWLVWAKESLGLSLVITEGIMPVHQAETIPMRAHTLLSRLDNWQLAAHLVLIQSTGSFVLGLAVAQGQLNAAEASMLADIEADFQSELWGEEPEAQAVKASKSRDIFEAARFLQLLY